jgi:3-oxoacyl-[acyl-carrier-protein] synthase II
VHDHDVLVTGMGFCLPGRDGPVRTAADLWAVAAHGQSCLEPGDGPAGGKAGDAAAARVGDGAPARAGDGAPARVGDGAPARARDGAPARAGDHPRYGRVRLPAAELAAQLPKLPGFFTRQFTAAHWFGLLALDEACADAGLDYQAGQLTEAAILTGRGGIDTMVAPYATAAGADPAAVTPWQAAHHVTAMLLAANPSDVNLAQAAVTRSTGPCFTVVSGCISSAVQLANAARMIAAGAVELAVVTGVDALDVVVASNSQRLTGALQPGDGPTGIPPLPAGPMRPYDRRGGPVAYGEGAAALILESRAHATRRAAHCYGRVLAHALARDGLPHPVALDEEGTGLLLAMRRCLDNRWAAASVPYVHGASDGQAAVTAAECQAIRTVYEPAGLRPLVTSQEACFGHNGAPAGCLGVALTLLMLEHGEVCPTAGCQDPVPGLPFDPVPGTASRALDFDYALNITFQAGGASSVILLGTPDAD